MLNRARFLLVHGVDARRWAKRHDLEPFTHPCGACGEPLTTSIPFAVGTLRGLVAPACRCGNTVTPYCVVRDRRHGDLFSGARA